MCTVTLLTKIYQTLGRTFQISGRASLTPGRVFKTQTQTHLFKSATVRDPSTVIILYSKFLVFKNILTHIYSKP